MDPVEAHSRYIERCGPVEVESLPLAQVFLSLRQLTTVEPASHMLAAARRCPCQSSATVCLEDQIEELGVSMELADAASIDDSSAPSSVCRLQFEAKTRFLC